MSRFKLLHAIIAVAMLVMATAQAQATLAIRINGTQVNSIATPMNQLVPLVGTGTGIAVSATSSSPGGPISSNITTTDVNLQNLTNGTLNYTVEVTSDFFTFPPNGSGASVLSRITTLADPPNDTGSTISFQSWISPANTLYGQGIGFAYTTGVQNPGLFDINSAFGNIASLSTPFSLTEVFTISVGAGKEWHLQAKTSITSGTTPGRPFLELPEPMSLLSAATGLPVMLLWLRRRNRAEAIAA